MTSVGFLGDEKQMSQAALEDHKRIPDALLDRVAEHLRAIADPSRLRLMHALWDGDRCVSELVQLSGLGPANVSKHLSTLHGAGWVSRRKEGLNVYYRLADRDAAVLCDIMCSRIVREAEESLREIAATAPKKG